LKYLKQLENLKNQGVNILEVDIKNIDKGIIVPDIFAIHPLTGNQIPLYITSYVHADYGTGCIMGVPAHDERD